MDILLVVGNLDFIEYAENTEYHVQGTSIGNLGSSVAMARNGILLLVGSCLYFQFAVVAYAQGVILQGAGPVNRSMGGASVAAPIDAIGAIYWNPATISGMERSETAISLDVLFPNHTINTAIGGFSESSEADPGTFPIPNVGMVHKTSNEQLTFGIGINTVAGFGTNIPASTTNPILAPPTGLGQISSNALFLQLSPVLSYAVTDRLSFAAGPTVTTGRVTLEPFIFDSANADGTYSTGNATRNHWGSGFQLGTYYIHDDQWRFGASFKSPVWMEKFEYNGLDQNGLPRKLFLDFDLPLIFSVGTSLTVSEKTLAALDIRFIDYANTDGLGDAPVFDATGALGGLGFKSVMSVSTGVQHVLTDRFTVRGGYTFNQNPVSNSDAFFNLASPVIFKHMLSGGASYNFSSDFAANLAYSYYFENSVMGPVVFPGIGAI
ncbi:MAG: outer membrane protein transport protein, partial [Aureliella sp.]